MIASVVNAPNPPVIAASPASVNPPVKAPLAMVPAICPTLAQGTLKPKPSVSLTFFGSLGFFPFQSIKMIFQINMQQHYKTH